MSDEYKELVKRILKSSAEPLETKEVQELAEAEGVKDFSRSKLLYRLNDLRGEGSIRGKSVGSGKGVWIWWSERKEE
jgi:hypothetical protein